MKRYTIEIAACSLGCHLAALRRGLKIVKRKEVRGVCQAMSFAFISARASALPWLTIVRLCLLAGFLAWRCNQERRRYARR